MDPRLCYVCHGSILTSYDRSRKKYRCLSLKGCQERIDSALKYYPRAKSKYYPREQKLGGYWCKTSR